MGVLTSLYTPSNAETKGRNAYGVARTVATQPSTVVLYNTVCFQNSLPESSLSSPSLSRHEESKVTIQTVHENRMSLHHH